MGSVDISSSGLATGIKPLSTLARTSYEMFLNWLRSLKSAAHSAIQTNKQTDKRKKRKTTKKKKNTNKKRRKKRNRIRTAQNPISYFIGTRILLPL
jgi:hypothetical protein